MQVTKQYRVKGPGKFLISCCSCVSLSMSCVDGKKMCLLYLIFKTPAKICTQPHNSSKAAGNANIKEVERYIKNEFKSREKYLHYGESYKKQSTGKLIKIKLKCHTLVVMGNRARYFKDV